LGIDFTCNSDKLKEVDGRQVPPLDVLKLK
jgi:hypothetical protein